MSSNAPFKVAVMLFLAAIYMALRFGDDSGIAINVLRAAIAGMAWTSMCFAILRIFMYDDQ